MRKFLYPLFFVAAFSLILYFFGEDLSSFFRKTVFIALLISLFFLFRNFIFSIFGFLFSRFSNIVRNILGIVLFLALFWALWSFLVPQDFKTRVAGGKNAIESTIATVSTEKDSLANAVVEEKKGIFGWFSSQKKEAEDATAEVLNETKEESKGFFASLFSREKAGSEEEKLNNGGLFSYETNGQTNVSSEVENNAKSEKTIDEEKNENGKIVPLTNDLSQVQAPESVPPSPKEIGGEKSEISLVKKMATTGADLTSTGPEDESDEVILDSEDAKMVFPSGYKISGLQHIEKESAQEKLQFTVEKNGQNATMQVALFTKGSTKKFDEYAEFFTQVPADGSISFVMSEVSEKKTVYISFFEGMMWEFSISSSEKMSENDLYSFLAPVAFKKKIEN